MPRPKLHTLESCIAAAAGCTSRNEFCAKNQGAHAAAYRNGWLDQVCPRKTNELAWTKEEIAEVSKLYATRSDMHRGPHQWALKVARKNGWLDVVPQADNDKPAGYWTKERVTEEAAKYETRSQFMQEGMGGYQAAWRNGWLSEVCSHMVPKARKAAAVIEKHPLRSTHASIKTRCSNPNDLNYHRYGGRGIRVCDRWANGEDGLTGFECFILDMGNKPTPDHSIDRIDNNGDYCPENCRWATQAQQMQNSSNAKLTEVQAAMIKFSLSGYKKLARLYGVDRSTIRAIRTGKAWANIDRSHLTL